MEQNEQHKQGNSIQEQQEQIQVMTPQSKAFQQTRITKTESELEFQMLMQKLIETQKFNEAFVATIQQAVKRAFQQIKQNRANYQQISFKKPIQQKQTKPLKRTKQPTVQKSSFSMFDKIKKLFGKGLDYYFSATSQQQISEQQTPLWEQNNLKLQILADQSRSEQLPLQIISEKGGNNGIECKKYK